MKSSTAHRSSPAALFETIPSPKAITGRRVEQVQVLTPGAYEIRKEKDGEFKLFDEGDTVKESVLCCLLNRVGLLESRPQ